MTEDPEECIGVSPNNLEASTTKGFEAETYYDQCTFGDVVGTCNMKESTQSDSLEKGNSEEECRLIQGEVTRLFGNYDAHEDTVGLGAEDENETYMMSHKRKRSDLDNNTNGPNSNEKDKADEFVPTMPQFGEMESCNFNLHQIFASDIVSGDEGVYQEKLESSPKGTPIASSKKSIIFSSNRFQVRFVNSLAFAKSAQFLVAGVGQEPRLGRWGRTPEARNGVSILPLKLL